MVAAQVVGNAFVEQYYQILHQSPGLVHRFYQDISKLGRPEDNGTMGITTTMNLINEKILSLNYGELRAEIKSVDAQESFDGGVHVLVTGYLIGKDNVIRNFAQTFFLAPQEKGYFVLNDMFRYVEGITQPDRIQVLANEVEAPLTTPEQHGKQTSRFPENSRTGRKRVSPNQTIINCDHLYINLDGSSCSMREKNVCSIAPPPQPPPPKGPTFSCPICMGQLVDEMSTKCGHIFCKVCLKTAISVRSECPTCREKMTMKDAIRVYLPATR